MDHGAHEALRCPKRERAVSFRPSGKGFQVEHDVGIEHERRRVCGQPRGAIGRPQKPVAGRRLGSRGIYHVHERAHAPASACGAADRGLHISTRNLPEDHHQQAVSLFEDGGCPPCVRCDHGSAEELRSPLHVGGRLGDDDSAEFAPRRSRLQVTIQAAEGQGLGDGGEVTPVRSHRAERTRPAVHAQGEHGPTSIEAGLRLERQRHGDRAHNS